MGRAWLINMKTESGSKDMEMPLTSTIRRIYIYFKDEKPDKGVTRLPLEWIRSYLIEHGIVNDDLEMIHENFQVKDKEKRSSFRDDTLQAFIRPMLYKFNKDNQMMVLSPVLTTESKAVTELGFVKVSQQIKENMITYLESEGLLVFDDKNQLNEFVAGEDIPEPAPVPEGEIEQLESELAGCKKCLKFYNDIYLENLDHLAGSEEIIKAITSEAGMKITEKANDLLKTYKGGDD